MAKSTRPGGIEDFLASLNLPALKRECLIRGLPFVELGDLDIPRLQSWFLKNYNNPVKLERLEEYDAWAEIYLKARKADPLLYCSFYKLGRIAEESEAGEVLRTKRPKTITVSKVKKRREKTQEGLFTGTKKALTFSLVKQGLKKADIIKQVMTNFPDAKEKSIGIWINKAKRGK